MTFPGDATTGSTALHDLAAVWDFVLALIMVGALLACAWVVASVVVWFFGIGKTSSPSTSTDDHPSK